MIEYENLGKSNAVFFKEYEESFARTLQSGWYILGNNVDNFEREFADYCGVKHCRGLASGLDALILSLRALEIEPGCEVIVPSNTYIATIISIIQNGLKPVLVEPDIATYNIDPSKIEENITAKTRAIMIVHLYGKPCDMASIMDIAQKLGLYVIEDCAQSHGAKFRGKVTGSFGDFGAFSFYPTKNLGALGDAGAVTMNQLKYDTAIKRLRNYGSDVKYYNETVGFNSRLGEMLAGFLSIKLKKLDEINEHKRRLASIYMKGLKSDFIKPQVHQDYYDVYHIFNIRHEKRDALREYLLKNGVKTEIHYPVAPHRQKAMKDFIDEKLGFEISELIHSTTLSLPISFCHTDEEVYRVIEIMNKF
ncbi:MAG: dTDP-3-amino-3,6-dideoxy-alpha-D-galactopyranose transaminase [bacterium ADurb.Bin243]|nr:MAG: dTDP-3-amino-3,6-dideoxy-alpha-D-galactopyranose transaminase [bacterium ADurb.Bin243]